MYFNTIQPLHTLFPDPVVLPIHLILCPLFKKIRPFKSGLCCLNTQECTVFIGSDQSTGVTSLKKTDTPSLSCSQLLATPQLRVGFHALLLSPHCNSLWLVLAQDVFTPAQLLYIYVCNNSALFREYSQS